MPPSHDPSDPQEWLRRARSNLAIAASPPARPEILYDDLCFEAQQAAEKAVKSVLVAKRREFPESHNIGELLDLSERAGVAVPPEVGEARRLTRYAVDGRYPRFGEDASLEEWRRAAALVERTLLWAESVIASMPLGAE